MIWLTGWGKDDGGDGHGTCEAGDGHYHDAVIMVVVVVMMVVMMTMI